MTVQADILNRTVEFIELIQESLFGSGYEDFRINRKLKIEVSGILQDLLEIFNIYSEQYKADYADYDWKAIEEFYFSFLINENGIDEKALWDF